MNEQLNLALGSGRKVRQPSFGGRNLIFFAIPEKKGLSQTCACCDHGSRCVGHRGAPGFSVTRSLAGSLLQAQGSGNEVVQQGNVFQIQLSG